jgi:hypothetical protein
MVPPFLNVACRVNPNKRPWILDQKPENIFKFWRKTNSIESLYKIRVHCDLVHG